MKRLLLPLIAFLALPTAIKSDVWIDEDGFTAIEIKENGLISFFDTGSGVFIILIKFLEMLERMKLNLPFA